MLTYSETYNLSEMKVTFIIIEDADLFRDL